MGLEDGYITAMLRDVKKMLLSKDKSRGREYSAWTRYLRLEEVICL